MRKLLRNYLDRGANAAQLLVLCTLLSAGCEIFGGGSGACLSTQVDFTSFSTIYCENEFDKESCEDFNAREVNGAQWGWHKGKTCEDLGFEQGSNEIGG
jgi:hypothetical protein